ncbi:hypothetical protein H6G97_17050 [Nostoc flagelliforme FACHB-838]|uniref:Uncharacterized protein n=1 Tax=Nostoc flagelliforme FACHB-838 TaxID=2692904 RepID=A0ABR8DQM6_9NOSO|nr:hypothetical protein [Nostoc flagelliforme]MBD2531200.1 hypothetical protein [Nostoc flagelliforme FACHB-838]
MKKIPMLTNFDLLRLRSARVAQLSIIQLIERTCTERSRSSRNQQLW